MKKVCFADVAAALHKADNVTMKQDACPVHKLRLVMTPALNVTSLIAMLQGAFIIIARARMRVSRLEGSV